MIRTLRRFCWRLLACGALASISIPSHAWGFLYPYDTFEGVTLFSHLQWMRDLPDDMPLSDVSIPGTWNSNVMDSPSSLGVDVEASQVTTIQKQLESGIRALSLSVQGTYTPGRPPLSTGHWKIESFDTSMLAISAFLAAHPSETVILRLDGTGGLLSPLIMSQRVNSVWVDPRWAQYFWKPGHRNPAIPTLAQVRGKIVLIQGPMVAQLNLSFAEQPGNPQFSVENDNHLSALSDLPAKWERVKAQLANAAANWQRGIFHTNTLHGEGSPPTYFAASGALTPFMGSPRMTSGHLSAFGNNGWEDFARTACLGDYRLCSITYRGLNELTMGYIETARPVHVGLVWADFPGRGLIDAI
ncbi:MAG: hypothetical protein JWP52_1158, partial [Rhizobacter sp.]|nr:hypothetical protein [Rhizobacter sp.]